MGLSLWAHQGEFALCCHSVGSLNEVWGQEQLLSLAPRARPKTICWEQGAVCLHLLVIWEAWDRVFLHLCTILYALLNDGPLPRNQNALLGKNKTKTNQTKKPQTTKQKIPAFWNTLCSTYMVHTVINCGSKTPFPLLYFNLNTGYLAKKKIV